MPTLQILPVFVTWKICSLSGKLEPVYFYIGETSMVEQYIVYLLSLSITYPYKLRIE